MNTHASNHIIIPDNRDLQLAKQVRSYIVEENEDDSPLSKDLCNITTQVEIDTTAYPFWILKTLDEDGNAKSVGGDEFYISYWRERKGAQGESSAHVAVAFISDREDGTYELDFVSPPLTHVRPPRNTTMHQHGVVSVHFQYSCNVGRMPPPQKERWKNGGATMVTYTKNVVEHPPIREYMIPYFSAKLSDYHRIIPFGDSLVEQLFQVPLELRQYRRRIVPFAGNIATELTTKTLKRVLTLLERNHGSSLKDGSTAIAIVFGSSVWDVMQPKNVQGVDFADHLQACRDFVHEVRSRYPSASLLWKGPTTVHIHRLNVTECWTRPPCVGRAKYMSSSRMRHLHDAQKALMHELRIPFLDLYDAYYLSADQTRLPADGRHFVNRLNAFMFKQLWG